MFSQAITISVPKFHIEKVFSIAKNWEKVKKNLNPKLKTLGFRVPKGTSLPTSDYISAMIVQFAGSQTELNRNSLFNPQ